MHLSTLRTAILVILLATASRPVLAQGSSPQDRGRVREAAAAWNGEWARARLALDTAAFQRLLPLGYFALFDGERMERAPFLEGISAPPAGVKVTRFDVRILTVSQVPEGWSIVVQEKLEMDRTSPDGGREKSYHLWIIRDLWKEGPGRLQLASGEVISTEGWRGGAQPPFEDW